MLSLAMAVLTVLAGFLLAVTGQLPWDSALPIILGGLAILGIHPAINTTPVAGMAGRVGRAQMASTETE